MEASEQPGEEVCHREELEGHYVYVIVIIFIELGGAKSRCGGKGHKRYGKIIMEAGVDPSRHHGLESLRELYLLILLFRPFFHLY